MVDVSRCKYKRLRPQQSYCFWITLQEHHTSEWFTLKYSRISNELNDFAQLAVEIVAFAFSLHMNVPQRLLLNAEHKHAGKSIFGEAEGLASRRASEWTKSRKYFFFLFSVLILRCEVHIHINPFSVCTVQHTYTDCYIAFGGNGFGESRTVAAVTDKHKAFLRREELFSHFAWIKCNAAHAAAVAFVCVCPISLRTLHIGFCWCYCSYCFRYIRRHYHHVTWNKSYIRHVLN